MVTFPYLVLGKDALALGGPANKQATLLLGVWTESRVEGRYGTKNQRLQICRAHFQGACARACTPAHKIKCTRVLL